MHITINMIKELRARTNCNFLVCKKALYESNGDLDSAIDFLRKNNYLNTVEKSLRSTKEGIVNLFIKDNRALLIEVNCETDFVSRDQIFVNFVDNILNIAYINNINNIDDLYSFEIHTNITVRHLVSNLIMKFNENIKISRFVSLTGNNIGGYLHHSKKIGVLLLMKEDVDNDLLKNNIAMHIAAMNPKYISPKDFPKDLINKERSILIDQMKNIDKPDNIIQKIIQGRLDKFINENSLLYQHYIKDSSLLIKDILSKNNAEIISFIRFELGLY